MVTKLDFGRLREAMSGPGADPRSWALIGRVDSDPDAVRYDPGTGWIADVTFTSGPLAQDGPVACRVAVPFGGNQQTMQQPVAAGCEVAVLLPDGDANVSPVILGYLHNPIDCAVPTTVNGQPVTEALSLVTHILVSPHTVEEQVLKSNLVAATSARVEGSAQALLIGALVRLADDAATQPYVRGTVLAATMQTLLTLLAVGFTTEAASWLVLGTFPAFALPPFAAAIAGAAAANTANALACTTAAATFAPGQVLSLRINGE
jgi:hypothetical protein